MSGLRTYAEWTDALGHHFFHEGRASQPVTFFVDDELIAFLAGTDDLEEGVESLVAAVRSRISPDSYERRFNRIEKECVTWKLSGANGFPPSLPLLAITVLAATRMARAEGIGSNNYWKRFRDVLGLMGRIDLKGNNDVFPVLWRQITWWLDDFHHGRLGRSTIEEHPWWTVIGFALSQALFRESDRQHLTDLFRRLGLTPGESPNPRELLQYFKAWAPIAPLSDGAKHMAEDSRFDERLTAILVDEAERWDGVLRDERGRRVGALLLQYEPTPGPAYAIAAERPEGFPERAVFVSGSRTWELSASIEGWYTETWTLEDAWLDGGLRLEADDFVLVYRPAPVIPLARNRVLGCWASVTRIEPGETYLILAEGGLARTVSTFLSDHALTDWKEEKAAFAPAGWVLFSGVVIEESLTHIPQGPLAVLAPRLRERPTLKGGLLLDASVGLYLCGGEPDLWLPSLFDPETEVRIDATAQSASPGQRISLEALRLPAGQHEVTVGAATLHFSTTRDLKDGVPEGTGSLGYEMSKTARGYHARSVGAVPVKAFREPGEVAISGAHLIGASVDLPASRATIVLPAGADRYRLVGSTPGEVYEALEPARPAWLDSAGDGTLYPIGFEVSPPFDPVWVVVQRPTRVSVRVRHAIPPERESLPASLAVNEWCDVFDLDPRLDGEAGELWSDYRAAAASLPQLPSADADRERERLTSSDVRRQKPAVTKPKPELVIERLIRLPLLRSTADRHSYESVDRRFQVTYWTGQGMWKASERVNARSEETVSLGWFPTEMEALAAVKRAIHTIRTVKR